MKPELAIAVFALGLGCSSPDDVTKSEEEPRVCHCNECDEPVTNTFSPSADAVPFCKELAGVKDAAMNVILRDDSVVLSVPFIQPVNDITHISVEVICEYDQLFDPLTGLPEVSVQSIRVNETEVGNPDHDWQQFYDDTEQNANGRSKTSTGGKISCPAYHADGILDRVVGGSLSMSCTWTPRDQTFPHSQKTYADRMRFVRDQLRNGQLLPSVRARNGKSGNGQ